MAKGSGLGDNLYVDTVDVSGDIASIGRISGSLAVQDVTPINASGMARIGLLNDGAIEAVAFWNPTSGGAGTAVHEVLKTLPTTDRVVSYLRGTAVGNPVASVVAKQVNYDPNQNADGSMTEAVQAVANGFGLDWGVQMTAGKRTVVATVAGDTATDEAASSAFGAQVFLHVFGFTGTSAQIGIAHSNDNGSTDPYAAIAALETTVTAATAGRKATANTATIKRWIRLYVTGTFTSITFALVWVRNQNANHA